MRALLTALILGLAACDAASAEPWPAVFGVEGRSPIMTLHAEGAQIYECKADEHGGSAWSFREPIATLIANGHTVGRHFAGPSWQVGEGVVKGKLVTSAPGASATDIPWLKLDVVDHQGSGALQAAKVVLRINTQGGVIAGDCSHTGDFRVAPYSADYVFLS